MTSRRESHMYHIPFVNDIRYRRGPVREWGDWQHSQFCQCHLERKLREQASK